VRGDRELKRYLRRATCGLWGEERAVVRAELEGNLRARVVELRIAGASEEEGVAQALAEIGDPALVSRGMVQVHTLPKALPLAATCLLLGSSVTVSSGAAPVSLIREGPAPLCATSTGALSIEEAPGTLRLVADSCLIDHGQSWLRLSDLRRQLRAREVRWEEMPGRVKLAFPGSKPFELKLRPSGSEQHARHDTFHRNGETYLLSNLEC